MKSTANTWWFEGTFADPQQLKPEHGSPRLSTFMFGVQSYVHQNTVGAISAIVAKLSQPTKKKKKIIKPREGKRNSCKVHTSFTSGAPICRRTCLRIDVWYLDLNLRPTVVRVWVRIRKIGTNIDLANPIIAINPKQIQIQQWQEKVESKKRKK